MTVGDGSIARILAPIRVGTPADPYGSTLVVSNDSDPNARAFVLDRAGGTSTTDAVISWSGVGATPGQAITYDIAHMTAMTLSAASGTVDVRDNAGDTSVSLGTGTVTVRIGVTVPSPLR